MKLTKEHIQFIDNYLDNSEVIYADIRMEMVDHVASEIETRIDAGDNRDFYYVFKDYMVEKKAQLLNENKQFLKSADKKIMKTFVKELKSPITAFLFLASCIGFYFLYHNYDLKTFKDITSIIPLIGCVGFVLTYVIYQGVKDTKRFSVVERMAFPFLAVYQLPNIFLIKRNEINEASDFIWLIGGAGLALTLMLILVIICIKLFFRYEKQYNHMV